MCGGHVTNGCVLPWVKWYITNQYGSYILVGFTFTRIGYEGKPMYNNVKWSPSSYLLCQLYAKIHNPRSQSEVCLVELGSTIYATNIVMKDSDDNHGN